MRTFGLLKNEKGFSLSFVMILIVILVFSGLAFLHAGYLERRLSMEARWDREAFYLAQTGIDRARATLGISATSWTTLLNDGTIRDNAPNPLLCPDVTRGCVIPPFQMTTGNPSYVTVNGQAITAPDIPFASTGITGSYSVRAFNNGGTGDAGTTDGDGTITLRSLGIVQGHQKVIEAGINVTSKLTIASCLDNTNVPPILSSCYTPQGNPVVVPSPGRDPVALPALPTVDLSSGSFYRNASNFSWIKNSNTSAPATLTNPIAQTFYLRTGNITLNGTGDKLVIFATGDVTVNGQFTNTIVIGATRVTMNKDMVIQSPSAGVSPITSVNYPAVIGGSGGVSGKGPRSTAVWGNIFSTSSIDLMHMTVHGSMAAPTISYQGGVGNSLVDDGTTYYKAMAGLTYPAGTKTNSVILTTWKEIQ